ncbi:MAG: ExeM/NucH family extracellular endonuclease, partial [Gemmatimonadaceae bacterium]|nr:ExeM/NucH family extracellular endonuclease [Chitinophagaceae bacterium]
MRIKLLGPLFLSIFLVIVAAGSLKSQSTTDIFISEYVEGSSNNKALEFFNATGSAIDLTAGNYVVQYYFNGNSTAGLTINLAGTIASNSHFVLAQSSATFITANGGAIVANQTNSGSWYNGNDAVVLRKGGASGVVIDAIGQVGFDPGSEWGTGVLSTADNTLRRKASACAGDTNPADAFSPSISFDGFATDTFNGLGQHTSDCSGTATPLSISPSALNFISSVGSTSQQSYTVKGNGLTEDIIVTVPASTEFSLSTNSGGPFTPSVTIDHVTANAAAVTIYVRFAPTSSALQAGNITHVSGSENANLAIQGSTTTSITPVYLIQGTGAASSFDGSIVTTEGIVTGDFQQAGGLSGFYIQDTTGDGNSNSSDGIFVLNNTFSVNRGDYVRLTAEVDEFNNLTELKNLSALNILSQSNPLPAPASLLLPFATTTSAEAYEGMLVTFSQTLTVTETFTLGRFGEVSLSVNGRIFNPTETIDPNDSPASGNTSTGTSNLAAVLARQSLNDRSRILLDDGSNTQNPAVVPYLNPADTTLRIGSSLSGLTGILDFSFSTYRLQPTQAPAFAYAPRPAVPSVGVSNLKLASFNVLNYFNGDGSGGGFPTARGAHTAAEFSRQRTKIINAIRQLNADVVGLIEIENDGSGASSSIADLVNGLNAATAPGTYALIADPSGPNGNTGTDAIRQAIIYKPAKVSPQGLAFADMNSVHNRPPIAQTFALVSNGEKFSFIVNHFKSKSCSGASGANADQGDGQSCFNSSRKLQASALLNFIATTKTRAADQDVVIVGDFNAYGQEDPIDILRAGGMIPVAETSYSYVFMG